MIWYAWLHNIADRRDDDWMKIEAKTRETAERVALIHMNSSRFYLGKVRNRKEMLRYDPEVVRLIRKMFVFELIGRR